MTSIYLKDISSQTALAVMSELTQTNLIRHTRIILDVENIDSFTEIYFNYVFVDTLQKLESAARNIYLLVRRGVCLIFDKLDTNLICKYIALDQIGIPYEMSASYSRDINISTFTLTDLITTNSLMRVEDIAYTKFDTLFNIRIVGTEIYLEDISMGHYPETTVLTALTEGPARLSGYYAEFLQFYVHPVLNGWVGSFFEATQLTPSLCKDLIVRKEKIVKIILEITQEDQRTLDSRALRILGRSGSFVSYADIERYQSQLQSVNSEKPHLPLQA